MAKNFRVFQVGESVVAANVRIVSIDFVGRSMRTTVYTVEMLCCGATREMTHGDIRKRAMRTDRLSGTSKQCAECNPAMLGRKKKATGDAKSAKPKSSTAAKVSRYKVKDIDVNTVEPPTWPAPNVSCALAFSWGVR